MINKILLEGYLFFNQRFLEMHDYKLSDIKKIDILFTIFKKLPFFFISSMLSLRKNLKIECRWEKFRISLLGISVLSNPVLSEISLKILRQIGKNKKKGILQHELARFLDLQSNDIHHHLINLLKFNLIRKYTCILQSNSKLSNTIQLKSRYNIDFKKLNYNQKQIEKRLSKNTLIFLLEKLIKIIIRMKKIIKQKKIKYGVLSFYNHSTGNYKRKLHRIWYKLKEKCNIINISAVLPKIKRIFEQSNFKTRNLSKPNLLIFLKKKKRNSILKLEKIFGQIVSLFFFPPENQIRQILITRKNNHHTSPMFLELFRGYVSYKTIQFTLKNLEKFRGLTKTLEQIGRQKIMHYYYDKIFSLYKKDAIFVNNKTIKRVTEQVLKRRVALLLWSKENFLQIKDLGRRFANFENKGLKKIDSKVVRRVLSDLITLGFLKVIKIYTQLSFQKPKIFEFILQRNPNNFILQKFIYLPIFKVKNISQSHIGKKNKKFSFLNKLEISFPDLSIYFYYLKNNKINQKINFVFSNKIKNLKINSRQNLIFNIKFLKKEAGIIKNRYFLIKIFIKNPKIDSILKNQVFLWKYFSKKGNLEKSGLFSNQSIYYILKNNQLILKCKKQKLFGKKYLNKFFKFLFKKKKLTKKNFIYDIFVEKNKTSIVKKKIIILHKKKIHLERKKDVFFFQIINCKLLNINFALNKLQKIYSFNISKKLGSYNISKCKWDCEIDTKIYSQFLFSIEEKKKNYKFFNFLQKKLFRKRIKGLSVISNIKNASIFFKKSRKNVKTFYLLNSFSYFYQVIKRSLELPNNTFFLSVLRIKNFIYKIKYNKNVENQSETKIFRNYITRGVYFKLFKLFFKKLFSSNFLIFLGFFIFSCKNLKISSIPQSINLESDDFNLLKIEKKKILNNNLLWDKKLNRYKKSNTIYFYLRVLKNLLIKKHFFLNKFDKNKIIPMAFFIKNKSGKINKRDIFNKKNNLKIKDYVELRMFFHICPRINCEKGTILTTKMDNLNKLSIAISVYLSSSSKLCVKKRILETTSYIKKKFKNNNNFYHNQNILMVKKTCNPNQNLKKILQLQLYLITWNHLSHFCILFAKNQILLNFIKHCFFRKNRNFFKSIYIKKYLIFCFLFSNLCFEITMSFYRLVKFFNSPLDIEHFVKIYQNENRIILIEVYGNTITDFPCIIPKNSFDYRRKYYKIQNTRFIRINIESLAN
nr:hypothetical protein Cry52Nrm3_p142 [Cryptomonas curvata]